ncbi:glycosyltransferase [Vibrio sp. 1075]|uniref:glycosyltransferase n=1 Tax=Vibrio sp. 1075 TaxID=3074543 RepID=UPI0029642DBB|nr:glycosyltransferase [Vibrio sp. 1075]MDW2309490.1 glycosyltransferase [Vibrio sp. 1075]
MKILFVITGLGYGGAETQLCNLVHGLREHGNECYIISMTPIEDGIVNRLYKNVESIVSLEMDKGIPNLGAVFRLRKLIKRIRPDVIHSHMIHSNIISRFANIGTGIRLVNTAHNVFEGGVILESMLRMTDFLSDFNTQVSEEGYLRYLSKGLFRKQDSRFVQNCIVFPKNPGVIDLTLEFGIEKTDFVLLCVARLEPVKNHKLLLESLVGLSNVHCIIVGDGYLREELLEYTKSLELEKFVTFAGKRDDIYEMMQSCDALVLSSDFEGFPIVVLEALASSLPIITTDVGAISSVVDSRNGCLIPVGDRFALNRAIFDFSNLSKKSISIMGQVSLRRSSSFSASKIAIEWSKIYSNKI